MARDGNRTDRVELRLEPVEKEAFQQAADNAGLPLSAWIRERCRLAAKAELGEVGKPVPFLSNKTRSKPSN